MQTYMARACQIRRELNGVITVLGISANGQTMTVQASTETLANGALSKLNPREAHKIKQLQIHNLLDSSSKK